MRCRRGTCTADAFHILRHARQSRLGFSRNQCGCQQLRRRPLCLADLQDRGLLHSLWCRRHVFVYSPRHCSRFGGAKAVARRKLGRPRRVADSARMGRRPAPQQGGRTYKLRLHLGMDHEPHRPPERQARRPRHAERRALAADGRLCRRRLARHWLCARHRPRHDLHRLRERPGERRPLAADRDERRRLHHHRRLRQVVQHEHLDYGHQLQLLVDDCRPAQEGHTEHLPRPSRRQGRDARDGADQHHPYRQEHDRHLEVRRRHHHVDNVQR